MRFQQAKNYYPGGRKGFDWIVIHDLEYPERHTGAEWGADFFAGANGLTAPSASAEYVVDDDSIVHCVDEARDAAWHTPGSLMGKEINRNSIGIEHSGYARQTPEEWQDPYSTSMLQMSAVLVAELCVRYDIPPTKLSPEELRAGARGICGHADCTTATGKGTHWDPGPGFPWDWYVERVQAHYNLLRAPVESVTGGVAPEDWPLVVSEGVRWAVAPTYIWPIGIGQAEALAREAGCELPNRALVDAVWEAADLKVDAAKMVKGDHDGTPATMASLATFNERAQLLERLVGGARFRLLAGYAKDVVKEIGVLGIYGWHRADGRPIQPFFSGHARGWIDYSQGLRLCRRV